MTDLSDSRVTFTHDFSFGFFHSVARLGCCSQAQSRYRISTSQVRRMGIGNFSMIVPIGQYDLPVADIY